ncbi:MAG: T9SS C-terminal target domain-containing protein [Bacteroidetes bacterium]|nr:MAG: T9SS C-terminal target domain-containing protein [Bacteroidota bacterium]
MKPLLWAILLCPFLSYSQLSITGAGTYTVDFDNTVSGVNNGQFQGAGLNNSPSAGQLDSDAWKVLGLSDGDTFFGGIFEGGDYSRGASQGGVVNGGIYAFETATGNYSLGIQPSVADFTPGDFVLRIQNKSGTVINELGLDYDIKVLNNEDRSSSFNFSWSVDDINYTSVGALDYVSPTTADQPPIWVTEHKNTTITNLNVANNGYLYLKWSSDDAGGTSGSRDEFGLDNIVISGIVLPVELVSFSASAKEGQINLEWETASELQNREFQVEHSPDGTNFRQIGSLPGHGTSTETHRYAFTHYTPSSGTNYYRLKQVDEDGTFSYSKIVSVRMQSAEHTVVYYNASAHEIDVRFSEEQQEDALLLVFDLSGRQLIDSKIAAGSTVARLTLPDVNPGMYIVQLRQRNKVENTRLVVNP